MIRPKLLLAVLAMAALPSALSAACVGHGQDQTAMSCATGTQWDQETGTCIPTTS